MVISFALKPGLFSPDRYPNMRPRDYRIQARSLRIHESVPFPCSSRCFRRMCPPLALMMKNGRLSSKGSADCPPCATTALPPGRKMVCPLPRSCPCHLAWASRILMLVFPSRLCLGSCLNRSALAACAWVVKHPLMEPGRFVIVRRHRPAIIKVYAHSSRAAQGRHAPTRSWPRSCRLRWPCCRCCSTWPCSGVPSVSTVFSADPGLITPARLLSFFFDLNQGAIVGLPLAMLLVPARLAAGALLPWLRTRWVHSRPTTSRSRRSSSSAHSNRTAPCMAMSSRPILRPQTRSKSSLSQGARRRTPHCAAREARRHWTEPAAITLAAGSTSTAHPAASRAVRRWESRAERGRTAGGRPFASARLGRSECAMRTDHSKGRAWASP